MGLGKGKYFYHKDGCESVTNNHSTLSCNGPILINEKLPLKCVSSVHHGSIYLAMNSSAFEKLLIRFFITTHSQTTSERSCLSLIHYIIKCGCISVSNYLKNIV